MAEIRKFNPGLGEGIGKLVREAVGGDVRPNPPGSPTEHPPEKPQGAAAPPDTPDVTFSSTTFSPGALGFLSPRPATDEPGPASAPGGPQHT